MEKLEVSCQAWARLEGVFINLTTPHRLQQPPAMSE